MNVARAAAGPLPTVMAALCRAGGEVNGRNAVNVARAAAGPLPTVMAALCRAGGDGSTTMPEARGENGGTP
ncbi:hypothetical protein [Streptomyces sp. CNQ085]|uniref:hypothetical protein n=1 Tax=Streptomyces sp. CNQ085 TaxID=2886944 RepID=UPI001F510743|nr:hypothetical protein [Streptomyces sp. CNQ085]MCI0385513.1 hypothetical protein [Streptomyces sp. CNQ085]